MQPPQTIKDGANTSLPPTTDTTLLLTSTAPTEKDLVKHLEDGKVVILSEQPKTTVDTPSEKVSASLANTTEPLKKRSLPDHVKNHFEANSREFVSFARKNEKKTDLEANEDDVEKNEDEKGGDVKKEMKIEDPGSALLWDKALLEEEYPDGRVPVEVHNSFVSIPKKEDEHPSVAVFPTRVIADTPHKKEQESPVPTTQPAISVSLPQTHAETKKDSEKDVISHSIPKKPDQKAENILPTQIADSSPTPLSVLPRVEPKNIERASFLAVPKKPTQDIEQTRPTHVLPPLSENKQEEETATPVVPRIIKPHQIHLPRYGVLETNEVEPEKTAAHHFEFEIPKKNPSFTTTTGVKTTPVVPQQKDILRSPKETEMGDILKTKIIEGQMRSVFENAPTGVQTTMEKMPAKDLLSPGGSFYDPGDVWKTRLREYIVKLKWQAKTVFNNVDSTDPKEEETVLEYIKRIYPAVVRAEINENPGGS